jgi:hypothetical protein
MWANDEELQEAITQAFSAKSLQRSRRRQIWVFGQHVTRPRDRPLFFVLSLMSIVDVSLSPQLSLFSYSEPPAVMAQHAFIQIWHGLIDNHD